MEFWGLEVETKETVKPKDNRLVHISQATLDIKDIKAKGEKGATALLYMKVVGQKKLLVGALSKGKRLSQSLDLVSEKEFKLSHTSKIGSVHFVGYQSPNMEIHEDPRYEEDWPESDDVDGDTFLFQDEDEDEDEDTWLNRGTEEVAEDNKPNALEITKKKNKGAKSVNCELDENKKGNSSKRKPEQTLVNSKSKKMKKGAKEV